MSFEFFHKGLNDVEKLLQHPTVDNMTEAIKILHFLKGQEINHDNEIEKTFQQLISSTHLFLENADALEKVCINMRKLLGEGKTPNTNLMDIVKGHFKNGRYASSLIIAEVEHLRRVLHEEEHERKHDVN